MTGNVEAFYIMEPGKTAIGNAPEPRPRAGEALLKTRLIGFCGTDLGAFRGKNPLLTYPRIPGHEIAATIVETGSGVPDEFRTGMNVTVYPNTSCGTCAACRRGRTNACKFNQTLGVQRDGAMQTLFAVPWQKLYRADALALRELVLVEPLAVGFHAAERGRVSTEDTVAVIGCGMVGLGVLASAVSRGARAIAIDVEDSKLALAKKVGAQHGVNSSKGSFHEELQELTGGMGPDVIVEAVGVPETYRMAVEEVAHTGRVVYIGWTKEPVTYETRLFVHKELDILGARNYLNEFPAVIDLLVQKKFPVDDAISAVVPFSEAGDALKRWSESPNLFTKIVVDLDTRQL